MAKLVYELNQSLDGYVDHQKMGPPRPALFSHFIERVRGLTGMIYGRGMYEVMRYWDNDVADWDAEERDYAAAWRAQPKWVVSLSLKSVGPNATLVDGDIEVAIRGLKAQLDGEIEVAGPVLAGSLTNLGLIDEYRIYLHPIVLGSGRPYFTGPRPPLRLVASGINALRSPERSMILITHYQRLLDHVVPDFLHVLIDGRIAVSGGSELALELEARGYGWVEREPPSSVPLRAMEAR